MKVPSDASRPRPVPFLNPSSMPLSPSECRGVDAWSPGELPNVPRQHETLGFAVNDASMISTLENSYFYIAEKTLLQRNSTGAGRICISHTT
jgi:hypothetical protein